MFRKISDTSGFPSGIPDAAIFKRKNFELLDYISWFSYDVDANTGAPSNLSVIEELHKFKEPLIVILISLIFGCIAAYLENIKLKIK